MYRLWRPGSKHNSPGAAFGRNQTLSRPSAATKVAGSRYLLPVARCLLPNAHPPAIYGAGFLRTELPHQRHRMTVRALIVGLVGAAMIAGLGYINDRVLELESIVAGHLLPVLVLGLLFVAMTVVNPLLFRARKKLAFRPAEVAVAVMLMVVSCSIPGRGLMEQFTGILAMPTHWNRLYPGWRKHRLMHYVPESFLAYGEQDAERLMTEGFIDGLGKVGEPIGLEQVPWGRWAGPLVTWVPLLVLMAVASSCLALVVHRQWSRRERLRYPIAEFATSLIEREGHRAVGGIFRRRLFWIALAIVLAIRVINGLYQWHQDSMIQIPMQIDLSAIGQKWPIIPRTPWGWGWLYPTIYPIVIGFTFFLASDISLSLGLTQVIFVPIAAVLVLHGVNMGSSYMAGGAMGWHRVGAYLAFALIMAYVGRRYYSDLLKQSLTFGRRRGVAGYEAWACRGLILSLAAMFAVIVAVGLDWTLAAAFVFLMMIIFLGISRISAETGLFFIQSRWMPMGALLGLLGGYALGPEGIIIVGLLSAVLCLDPSMALMPHLTNALRMCDNLGVRPGRVGIGSIGTYVMGLAVAIPVVLWANYNYGITRYGWTYQRVPTMSFRPALGEIADLKLSGELAAGEQLTPLQRFSPANIRPKPIFLWAFATGFGLVILVSLLRLRLSWWPLHPVIFLVWATYPMFCFFPSFLLGWLIKTVVTRLGGYAAYQKTKPFMIGLIAGDVLGALVFMVAGAIYYGATGNMPVRYQYFPR